MSLYFVLAVIPVAITALLIIVYITVNTVVKLRERYATCYIEGKYLELDYKQVVRDLVSFSSCIAFFAFGTWFVWGLLYLSSVQSKL